MKRIGLWVVFFSIFTPILVSPPLQGEEAKDSKVHIITNSLGMKFVLIAAGSFTMGSSPAEQGRHPRDEEEHRVRIEKPFYLQTTEVTQGQWKRVMGNNPSSFKECGDECPVEMVSWYDAQEFIRRLRQLEGTDKYRLPTEAEWEYACRAGTTTPFYTGLCISTEQANYKGSYPLEACEEGKYRRTAVSVGSFPPNPWGLYDMHGNVCEWCQDRYGTYPTVDIIDPKGPSTGEYHVLRGGSWLSPGKRIRSASRMAHFPATRDNHIGFRLAMEAFGY
jgi:formylglycine-generating enzyme required for sulfatase activity